MHELHGIEVSIYYVSTRLHVGGNLQHRPLYYVSRHNYFFISGRFYPQLKF
jgi:hypothetical protein